MTAVTVPLVIIALLLLPSPGAAQSYQENPDTAVINKQSRDAYVGARRTPDISIIMAHQALSASRQSGYSRGVADASLALGMAYLAKYNQGDSARYYNELALSTFEETGDITGKARACYGLSYVFSFKGDYLNTEKYGTLALQYFEEAADHRGMINSLNVLSYVARQKQDLEKAKGYLEKAVATAGDVKDTLALADATNNLGNVYKEMALFSQSIDKYFEALRLWELKSDSSGMSLAHGSIGLSYFYQKDYDMALEYFKKHLNLSERRKDLWEVSKVCNNIAQVYNARGLFDSALFYQRRTLTLSREINLTAGEADISANLASTFLHLRLIDSAHWYINRAIDIRSGNDQPVPPEYYITFGNILQSQGRYHQAAGKGIEAYNTGKKMDLPLAVVDASLLLSDIYAKTGRQDLAYKYLKEHTRLKDSISNDEFLTQVTRMEIQYDFDKKEKAAEYEREQQRLIQENKIREQRMYLKGLFILLALLTLISLLYIRQNRLKSQYARIDLEQRLLRTQMNPHFIFNSLCAVQDLIMADKPQKANAFLTKIARLMRNILENSGEEYVALDKEIETLRLYMDVQQFRFEKGFEYNINIDQSIDTENISVPPMLAQPCVENSIEHGLLPGKEGGRVTVSYAIRDGLMMLEVTDNGVGRVKAAEETPRMKKQSISTKLTEKRLEHFRKILKEKQISYEIIDLYEDGAAAGTKVVMMLPYKNIYA